MYEQLYLLSTHGQMLVDLLGWASGKPGIPKHIASNYRGLVQEVCSFASQDILKEASLDNPCFQC